MILFLLFLYYLPRYVPLYGDILGWSEEGVVSYSNYKRNKNERSYAGEKWECVEFVRRFLMTTRGITFNEIDHAYNIFDLTSFQTLDGVRIPILIIRNDGINQPEKGDILVWDRDVDESRNGHVAIVVDRKENEITIIEQNWENEEWGGRNYSRVIDLNEPSLTGWIKI